MAYLPGTVDPSKMAVMGVRRDTNNFTTNALELLNPITECYDFRGTYKSATAKIIEYFNTGNFK